MRADAQVVRADARLLAIELVDEGPPRDPFRGREAEGAAVQGELGHGGHDGRRAVTLDLDGRGPEGVTLGGDHVGHLHLSCRALRDGDRRALDAVRLEHGLLGADRRLIRVRLVRVRGLHGCGRGGGGVGGVDRQRSEDRRRRGRGSVRRGREAAGKHEREDGRSGRLGETRHGLSFQDRRVSCTGLAKRPTSAPR